MGDLFESTLHLEQDFIDEGHTEGIRDGRAAGLKEGEELGVGKGFEIGQEVGFYWGSVQVWRLAQQQQLDLLPERIDKAVTAIETSLTNFPRHPQDERLQDSMAELRGKFKMAVVALGLKDAYFPEKPSDSRSIAF